MEIVFLQRDKRCKDGQRYLGIKTTRQGFIRLSAPTVMASPFQSKGTNIVNVRGEAKQESD